MNKKIFFITLLLGIILISGCTSRKEVSLNLEASTTPTSLMPEMKEYDKYPSEELTRIMATGGDALVTATGQAEAVLVIEKTKKVVDCYHDVGAVETEAYTSKSDVLSAGVVAIGDKNQLLNPANLWTCVFTGGLFPQMSVVGEYELCGDKYTIVTPTNKYYVIFAGTSKEICQDICHNLKGCKKF